MAAVSRLPQLLERKRTIEKHTNMLHNLLKVGLGMRRLLRCHGSDGALGVCSSDANVRVGGEAHVFCQEIHAAFNDVDTL